ncbi:MAG: LytTR family transcriptional regulator [Bacteroidales bacterium]|nr:LytTR family transcriptional regulator [Bacteroidales bacterium]
MKRNFTTAIFVKEEELASWLKDSLSKFSSCQKVFSLSETEEALEELNHHSISILFIDEEKIKVIGSVRKPAFIIPICERLNMKRMKKLFQWGCFDILFKNNRDESLKIILGKILQINSYYSSNSSAFDNVEEPTSEYLNSSAKFIFTEESIFLPATKSQPAVRLMLNEIQYIMLDNNMIFFYMENGDVYERRKSLKYFINKLPKHLFQKINQKTIVNVKKIDQMLRNDYCSIGENRFKVTRSFKNNLKNLLHL